MKLIAKRPEPLGFKWRPFFPTQLRSTLLFKTISLNKNLNLLSTSRKTIFAPGLSNRIVGHERYILTAGKIEIMLFLKFTISFLICSEVLYGESLEPMWSIMFVGFFFNNGVKKSYISSTQAPMKTLTFAFFNRFSSIPHKIESPVIRVVPLGHGFT